jgi:thiosulfate dehydrogenase [quinone] large subunit
MNVPAAHLSRLQQISLVLLRTAIGWHFLYEGYFKLVHPAWSRAGAPLEPFSSGGYLQGASGPLGDAFRWLAQPAWLPWIDGAVAVALVLAGLMLMLGLLTQLGCAIAAALLAAFYLSTMPLTGVPVPRAEGTYLIVNKNLIELVAVVVVMAFRTGRIAGLDLLLLRRPAAPALQPTETVP